MMDFPSAHAILAGSGYSETADIETSSEGYARRFQGAAGKWFLQVQEDLTMKCLESYPRASILDVGGGHGQVTEALANHHFSVTVLGSAQSCSERIRPFIEAGQCEFQVGNILHLPYPDQSFDVALSYRLLPHVGQWELFLSELARVARRAVIVDYPEKSSINTIAPYLFGLKKQLEGNTRVYTCFHESELNAIFQKLGFVRSERYPQFFAPMVLHRKLNSVQISTGMEKAFQRLGLTKRWGSPVIVKYERQQRD